MHNSRVRRLAASVIGAIATGTIIVTAQTTTPPFHPLEITNISAVGVNGMAAQNRIFRAYPGLEYNIRAAVVGGVYPYTYSLSNAPAGMTINASTGEISWPNPTASASNVQLAVQDSIGATDVASWNINVTTTGFKFVDAINGQRAANNGCSSGCGTGTATSPWRTLYDVYLNDTTSDIVYFRNGTYNVNDIPVSQRQSTGSVWERVVFSDRPGASVPGSVIWLAYPSHQPLIDFGYRAGSSPGAIIRFNGDNVYVDGFETVNSRVIGFQFEPAGYRGPVFRRMRMHAGGPGGDGSNSSFIMTVSTFPNVSYGMVIQDSSFYDVNSPDPDDSVIIKIYSQDKLLIENTTQYNAVTATELKADVRNFTVRGNTLYNLTGTAIGGNMHGCVSCSGGSDSFTTGGEISFNNVRGGSPALDINQDSQARQIYVYRNTFNGRVQMRSVDSSDGPFYLSNNVIVNNDAGTPSGSHVYHLSVTAASRIVLANNLVGYPNNNIIDGSGLLTSGYANYIGTHGHQLGAGSNPPPTNAPRAPSNLRILSE